MPDAVTPEMLRLSNAFRAQLLARERRAASQMVRYYGHVWQRLQGDIGELSDTIDQMRAAGEEITPGMIGRLDRMEAIRAQAGLELLRFSRFADTTITAGQREAIAAAQRQAPALIKAAYPEGAAINVNMATLPREAVQAMVGTLVDGSPIRKVIEGYVGNASGSFADKMVTGLAAGWNPRRLARELRQAFGMGLTQSLRLARTEQLRAYRTATLNSYQKNDHVVKGWSRSATLDDRTCMACFVDWKVPILTSKGFVPILHVKVGDLVMTHQGRFRPVTELIRQSVDSARIVTIRLDVPGGRQLDQLTMTVEHPVLTQRGWIRADELATADCVAVPTLPCVVCGAPVLYRYKGGKTCSRACVGRLAAAGLHNNPEAHGRAVRNMTATHHQMMARGEHPFQDPEIQRRARRRALQANSLLTSSKTEGVLAQAFDDQGLDYETQYPIYSHYTAKNNRHYHYYADFAFPDEMLVVEADGEPWHSWDAKRVEHDTRRQKRIEAQGWQVLRYTGAQIRAGASDIAEEVQSVLMNHQGSYGMAWVPIKSIEHSTRKAPASFRLVRYNLEVEEDHSYVAKHAIVHNCIMLDGKEYSLDESMDDHPSGRCALIPRTKSYREMGLDVDEPDFSREMAQDWFLGQDEATQRKMMGDRKWEAWQAGQFKLEDLPRLRENKTWGNSWTPASLKELMTEQEPD